MNPYIELGIPPTATFDELKQAYRQAVFRYHPDSAYGVGNPEKFNAVLQAYETLKLKYESLHPSLKSKPIRHQARQPATAACSVEIDAITLQMPIEHLIYNLENSENVHVHWAAMQTLVLKNNPSATAYLLNYLHHIAPEIQCSLIRFMGEQKLEQAASGLFPWIFSPHSDVAFAAIKSLEIIAAANRTKIVQCFKQEGSHWNAFLASLQKATHCLNRGGDRQVLGKILLKNQNISSEQLQIALWLQKKHQLLLGATLTQLGYTSHSEIQHALSLQKR